MGKNRFNEEQIIGILREQEAEMPTAEVGRKHPLAFLEPAKEILAGDAICAHLAVGLKRHARRPRRSRRPNAG